MQEIFALLEGQELVHHQEDQEMDARRQKILGDPEEIHAKRDKGRSKHGIPGPGGESEDEPVCAPPRTLHEAQRQCRRSESDQPDRQLTGQDQAGETRHR
ncbi:MAG: hypothetical protein AUH35_02275 [Nitrospirae bacterium 13_1_40CM_62_7]|nr:MAG: hypothetical protein AUH35_02275 [Nitrospirae bacterium 13_1_40CM_62_7]